VWREGITLKETGDLVYNDHWFEPLPSPDDFYCPSCGMPVTHFNPYKTGYHCYYCECPLILKLLPGDGEKRVKE